MLLLPEPRMARASGWARRTFGAISIVTVSMLTGAVLSLVYVWLNPGIRAAGPLLPVRL